MVELAGWVGVGGWGGWQQRLADCLSHDFPGRPATTGRCPSFHVDRGFSDVASLWSLKASLLSLFSAQRQEVFNIAARLRDRSSSGIPFFPPASRSFRAQKQSSPPPISISCRLCVASSIKKLLTTVNSCSVSNPLARKWRRGRRFHRPGKVLSRFSCRSTSRPRPLPLDWIRLQRCHRRVQTPFDC